MSNEPESEVEVLKSSLPAVSPERQIDLSGDRNVLDLSGLSDQQVDVLRQKHAELAIDTAYRAKKIGTDVNSLAATLKTISEQTEIMSDKGMNVTVTNTRDDNLGRTEIIVGNSEAAKTGKLTRSQKGMNDSPVLWMGFALVVLLIFAILFAAMN